MNPSYASPRSRACATALAALLALTGCATTTIHAQWSDPQMAGRSYAGQPLVVACSSADITAQRLCEDQVLLQLQKLGAPVRLARSLPDAPSAANAPPEAYLASARQARASAVVFTAVAPGMTAYPRSGSSVGVGLGGFGGGHVGFGIGMSMPVGQSTPDVAWTGNTSVLDVDSGRTAWSASATAVPSSSTEAQIASLADVLVAGARKAGFL